MTIDMPHNTTLNITGTAGGTLAAIIGMPSTTAIVGCIILAALGALTGFITTIACKALWKYITKKFNW